MIQFEMVTAVAKANVYFDGKVVSHTILFPDGSKKTLGLIYAGEYTFHTGLPERMEILAGSCHVQIAGQGGWKTYRADESFDVPGESFFEIRVLEGITEYVCSFIQ